LGSPVPASTTGLMLGCTATAPTDSDGMTLVPAFALKTGSVSVSGAKVAVESAPAALVDFQTPPVVPR